MSTPTILALATLAACLLCACLLPRQTWDALKWWRDFGGQLCAALWLRFVAWHSRAREAFEVAREVGREE